MKIIISHDVDHLYATDHIFKDLILEKLWIRSFLELLSKKISIKTFLYRLSILFHNRMHRIDELMEFDKNHEIPSVFFFGMRNVLGMSYSKMKAIPIIQRVKENNFDIGVHGVDYTNIINMKNEYNDFAQISKLTSFGLRNHYVRYDADSFKKMEQVGYLYDSTEFNKEKTFDLKMPYKVGKMWEFPLCIMDGYICKSGKYDDNIERTKKAILEASEKKLPYLTILFHDYQFDDNYYPEMKKWYIETISFCEEKGFDFISYRDAIKELETCL